MTKLAAVSQADLLRLLLDPDGPGLNDTNAEFLGYERIQTPSVSGRRGYLLTASSARDLAEFPEQPAEEPENEFPSVRPKLKFLMPVRAETLKTEPPDQDAGNPITNDDLRVPWGRPALPHQPLIAWSRLASFLKNRLGTPVRGVRLDERKLMRQICSGRPLQTLPRRMRTGWAPQAVILWDETPEMFPFVEDVQWLYERLARERGSDGLTIINISNMQSFDELLAVPASVPVLAISAMGQHSQNAAVQAAWRRLSRKLKFRRQNFHALTPCPRRCWTSTLARAWSASAWDRGQRLPRTGGMAALPSDERCADVTEALLDLLAPASRIEPPLLRETRLLLGPSGETPSADIGTEWDAWHHADCRHSDDSFGFKRGATSEQRLHRAVEPFDSSAANTKLLTSAAAAIRKHHQRFAKTVAFEAEFREVLARNLKHDRLNSLKPFLESVVDRLRQLAERPTSNEGRRTGLSAWFTRFVDGLSRDMRKNTAIKQLIAQGLALAHTWQRADAAVPAGVDPEAYAEESRRAALRVRDVGSPTDITVGLDSSGITFDSVGDELRPAIPIGRIRSAAQGRLQVAIGKPTWAHRSLQLGGDSQSGIMLDSMPTGLIVESTHSRLEFETVDLERLSWADRVWCDQYGIAAEFSIREVSIVLRWIPPGRFLMGSPESETGRYNDEGPQHEVTISHGFWMGETPVTQAQWAAVVEAAQELPELLKMVAPQEELNPAPSRFHDSADSARHPVEQINWHAASKFCHVLNTLMVGSPNFRLPTEAHWEYGCRAGTQSAFNDGSICTVPEGHDPALDQLGWFNKNSEKTTHPVQEKRPNAWGLYDMHGNVWEWCADGWDEQAYKTRIDGVVDPVTDHGNSADRVVRGGSWGYRARLCRAAVRDGGDPADGWSLRGLRLFAGQDPGGAERPSVP